MPPAPPVQEPMPVSARHPLSSLARGDVGPGDMNDDLYDADEDTGDRMQTPATGHSRLPVPEPEAQPLQRSAADARQQRPIRRMDPKALDLPRGSRNAPPGDAIDIPAFLRKR